MKQLVHLAKMSLTMTDYELFPCPKTLINGWNEDMAQRILPIATFDVQLSETGKTQKLFLSTTMIMR